MTKPQALFPKLETYTEDLLREADQIPKERQAKLERLAEYIRQRKASNEPVRLTFICTHNSRRSHISQIWAAAAAVYFGLENIYTFSGGTEATAFNPRAVAAMQRAGFQIENPGGENPHYRVAFAEKAENLECFSKTYDDPFNPQSDFAAIMTCSQADENCPFIPGAAFRLSLPYDDPKAADDTPEETDVYDERVRQIGRELFFAMQKAVDNE